MQLLLGWLKAIILAFIVFGVIGGLVAAGPIGWVAIAVIGVAGGRWWRNA